MPIQRLPGGAAGLADAQRLATDLIDRPDCRWGVYQASSASNPGLAIAGEWIERMVFADQFDLTPDELVEEFEDYDDRSIWTLIVHHPTGTPVASVRSIVGPIEGHKMTADCRDFWDLDGLDLLRDAGFDPSGAYIEGATFSVLPEWRSADRGWPMKLIVGMHTRLTHECAAFGSWQVIYPPARRAFAKFGYPFVDLGPALDIKGYPFQPTVSPRHPYGTPWLRSSDREYLATIMRSDETSRGGTRLPMLDLKSPWPSEAARLHAHLRGELPADLPLTVTAG